VRKLNAAGSAVVYYRTIEGQTTANGIAVDSQGSAYVAGASTALDFPAVNALQSSAPYAPIFASSDAGAGNVEVTYAGLAPGWAGLYQVNFRLPSNGPLGGLLGTRQL
jgi:uncharacterized protein (TIGR03437 family)